jgi:hypothetical protein
MRWWALASSMLLWFLADLVHAEILIVRCSFPQVPTLVITNYDNGTPARVDVASGVGNRAEITVDPADGEWTVVELDDRMVPFTLTIIQPDLRAARHAITREGTVLAPSQGPGRCERVPPR